MEPTQTAKIRVMASIEVVAHFAPDPAPPDPLPMPTQPQCLPQVGDPAPEFSIATAKGTVDFPAYSAGCWCILCAHPANFTSAWTMYSTFLALKERWFDARNTKLLTLSTEPIRHEGWSGKVRRYIGIYLGAPVIEDLDFSIAMRYGMASGRIKQLRHDRLAFIIDPEGIIRLIVDNLEPSIEHAILRLENELDRLQGNRIDSEDDLETCLEPALVIEESDPLACFQPKPAYFRRDKINPN
jgi:alkyl hydroperoxide reductase subunit AhpC